MGQLIALYQKYKDQVPDSRFWTFDDFMNWIMQNYEPSDFKT